MRFANAEWLLLLLLLPLFFKWWLQRNRPPKVTLPLPLDPKVASKNPTIFLLLVKCLSLVFFILALARPQASFHQTERSVNGVDIILLLDVSMSMNIEDLGQLSRLETAKAVMDNFIKGRKNDRIGLVAFSGEPLTLAPPTLDYGLVLSALENARVGVLRDGTAIGDGLSLSVAHLRNSKAKSRTIILLTDGENNVGQVDPLTAGELAAGYEIRVYTIAVGREGRQRLPIKTQGPFGNAITTYQWFDNALNPELLQKISERTKAKFYRVTDESALQSVFNEIDRMEKTEIKTQEKIRYEERFQIPLKLGMVLFLIQQVLALGFWRFLP